MKSEIDAVLVRGYSFPDSFPEEEISEALGLGYIASKAMQDGYTVAVFDGFLFRMTPDDIVQRIRDLRPLVVGFSAIDNASLDYCLRMIDSIRDLNSVIVIGGVFTTFNWQSIPTDCGIDYLIIGEGEYAFVDLLACVKHGKDKKRFSLRGAPYCAKGDNFTKARAKEALDDLPDPFRYGMPQYSLDKSVLISSSRGCINNCFFCSVPSMCKVVGKKYRMRSPRRVVEEIINVRQKSGMAYFRFVDDNFMLPISWRNEWIKKFMVELQPLKGEVHFSFGCSVSSVNERIFSKLKNLGLGSVFIGIESLVPRARQFLHKSESIKTCLRAYKICRDLEILVSSGFIMFDPFTTLEEVKDTLDVIQREQLYLGLRMCNTLMPYRGTAFWNFLNDRGMLITSCKGDCYRFKDRRVACLAKWLHSEWRYIARPRVKVIERLEKRFFHGDREITFRDVEIQKDIFIEWATTRIREFIDEIASA